MNAAPISRDERTTAVERVSYRVPYLVLSYGLLALTLYRIVARRESPWDLLTLVVVGGLASAGYEGRAGILGRRWPLVALGTLMAAAIVAAVLAVMR